MMPELPEVETIVRDLSKSLQGKTIAAVTVHDAFLLRAPASVRHEDGQKAADFIKRLNKQVVKKISRRGKAIIIEVSSGEFLVIQLMMTGQMIFNGAEDKHTRLTFTFTDKTKLLYNDQRRFGQLRVVKHLNEVKHFNILGPEPFSKEFTPDFMQQAFKKTMRPIKNVLLDHTFVAGIGNIYACEILFRSRLSPKREARRVSLAESKTVHQYIVEVLKEAIQHRGSSLRNYRDGAGEKGKFNEHLAVYARQNQPCPRCKRDILRIVQSGRSTFYCGHCQK
jgi:formamidopyrimidine-DNA glycosylase